MRTTSTAKPRVKYGVPDDENPEWTRERIQKAMSYPNLPPELLRIIEADKKKRGPQKAAKKEAVSIRLSSDILQVLRDSGPGWQTRVDTLLRAHLLSK